ncbi:MAG: parvulin-like peptidyl-prolyl [Planctomycetota bacterium]|nr:MAG: parvulin-like peptidyl-prolyl [Planctomycetota bacterium]
MRFATLALLICLATPVAAQDPEPDPAKTPTKPAEAPDEVSGSVVIVGWKGAPKAFPVATRTKEEAKAKAEEALKAARAKGSSFFDVVVKFSDEPRGRGGVGIIPVGHCTIPALEKALAGMEYGQVSDIFETDLGFMIATRLTAKASASHILIAWKGAERAAATVSRTKEEARALAEKVHQAVTDKGEDFAKVAGEMSDCSSKAKGGDLGTFPRNAMAPEFEDAAFALAPGEISGVVESAFGFHVIKATKIVAPLQWRASHILVRWKGTERCPAEITRTKEDAKKNIEALIKRLNDGEDFAKLAGENSDCPSKAKGGDLGTFGPNAMVPEFEKATRALAVGKVSGVVETSFGYHLIKRTK